MSRILNVPEPIAEHRGVVRRAYRKAMTGWYVGDMPSLNAFCFNHDLPTRSNPNEAWLRILFSRDRMHHSVGWWRNAEYEYCWHLSLSAWDAVDVRLARSGLKRPGELRIVDLPEHEETYWGRLFFEEHADKVWHEPGGTDPRLTREEAHRNKSMVHLRLFVDPETFQPFIPTGEVYDLTRWIPGLTPEKVDRV